MSIRSIDSLFSSLWDWDILKGCFETPSGAQCLPMDIDGLIHRGGKFLLLETKAVGVDLSAGQERCLEALRQTGVFTIFIVWGIRNCPSRVAVWTSKGKTMHKQNMGVDILRHLCRKWWRWAGENEA